MHPDDVAAIFHGNLLSGTEGSFRGQNDSGRIQPAQQMPLRQRGGIQGKIKIRYGNRTRPRLQRAPGGIVQEDGSHVLQPKRGKKGTGLHVVFQDGEYCLAHARHARTGIIQHQDVAAIQGRQFMLQQIFLGRVLVAHCIKNNNQVRPVLPDFIMQHFGGEDIIGEKRERAQGKEEGHQNP